MHSLKKSVKILERRLCRVRQASLFERLGPQPVLLLLLGLLLRLSLEDLLQANFLQRRVGLLLFVDLAQQNLAVKQERH